MEDPSADYANYEQMFLLSFAVLFVFNLILLAFDANDIEAYENMWLAIVGFVLTVWLPDGTKSHI